jgi:ELKS/RAB6-interacting/CAST family protein 1
LDRQQRDYDLQESKQQLDIRDRKINVLNRKIENLEEQIRDKSTQITLARAKLSAATTTAATINIQQQTSATNNTLVSNLETTIGEKERLIEKLREQKHTLDIEHQEEIEQLQKTLNETRLKLEQKEKDYYEGQVSDRCIHFNANRIVGNVIETITFTHMTENTNVLSNRTSRYL